MIDGYSEEFESTFLEHLRRNHPSSRVSAQNVYNEYIADKHHIHMNSTKWLTLTEFVKYLGRTGKCKVDQTEKGWFIVYQKRDMEEELNEERKAKRHKAEKVRLACHSSTLICAFHASRHLGVHQWSAFFWVPDERKSWTYVHSCIHSEAAAGSMPFFCHHWHATVKLHGKHSLSIIGACDLPLEHPGHTLPFSEIPDLQS